MDPQVAQVFDFILGIFPYIAIIVVVSVAGALLNNWLKIKNGYPLSNSWGMPMHPKTSTETTERIKLLTNENAQLRAELGSLKDRLQNVERIVTDRPTALSNEIDALAHADTRRQ
jgi:hypothetical protein